MLKRQRRQVDKGSWLTTYSDMVTLLLCFFVLMYASSTVDNAKWEVLVRNLNPSASVASNVVNEMSLGDRQELLDEEAVMMTEVDSFDQLYRQMKSYVEENDMSADIDVRGGDGYVFIVFRNNILFDGDRYSLKQGGKDIIDFLCSGIVSLSGEVKEMRILGHTNQADPNRPNDVRGDRFLASNRATEVLVYIQEKNILDPKKLVGIGYGQFYPAAPFVREEDRLKNRRVEIMITEANALDVSLERIYTQMEKEDDANAARYQDIF